MNNSTKRVDILRPDGSRVYVGMIDDPRLSYLHWGDSFGFVTRDDVKRDGLQIVRAN